MLRTLLASVLLLTLALAQSGALTTTLVGGNGQKGNLFNITNTSGVSIVITGFDQNFWAAGTDAMEVYYLTAGGSYATASTNPAAWTLVGSVAALAHGGPGTAVPLTIPVNVMIPPGGVQGFYVTVTNATTGIVAYTNGTALGAVFASDAFISFHQGVGNVYPFGGQFSPRVWNGVIHYQIGGTIIPEFNVNSAGSSLDMNGVQGTIFNKANSTVCTNSMVTANFGSTNVGALWEVLISPAPSIPLSAGALTTPNGQILNIDVTLPIVFLNGGATFAFTPFPGSFAAAFNAGGSPFVLCAQQVVVDVTHPDGFVLSQCAQLSIIVGGAQALTLTDDSSTLINLSGNTICTPSSVSFYGTSYTQVQVISNGRLMFGAPNTSFAPTVATAMTDAPSFGVWADYNPGVGGTVTASSNAGLGLTVAWAAVPYFGNALLNSFSLSIDISGQVLFDGLTGISAGTGNAWFGASKGNTGATDPGITAFAVGGPNAGPAGNGMLYKYGIAGATTAGLNQLMLLPNGAGNFDWAGF